LKYFSLIAATVALGTEVLVFLLLMEVPPFGKGGSDIIWDLPAIFLPRVAFRLAPSPAINPEVASPKTTNPTNTVGLLLNGLSLAIPTLVLVLAVGRLVVSAGGLTNR
jgi:hypothetical protein